MAAKTTPNATATKNLIPVRLNLLVHVDADAWNDNTPEAAAAPTVDADAVLKGMIAAGVPEDQAKAAVAALTAPKPVATRGPATARTEVREYMLEAVRGLERLTAVGAVIADADRQAITKEGRVITR